jgi:hypothetical protein
LPAVIVDTNVAKVANGDSHASAKCVLACLDRLDAIKQGERVVLDDSGEILGEYLAQRPHNQFPPGAGLAFLVWVNDNQANPERCRIVHITPLDDDLRWYEEFPDDPALSGFDLADRKFVAAARACADDTPVLNAVDTDWRDFEEPLAQHGVRVEFLCPEGGPLPKPAAKKPKPAVKKRSR